MNEGESYSSYQLKSTFSPEDSVNYLSVSKSVVVNVIPLAPENATPTILFSSDSATRIMNESIEFNVTAIGAKPLSYQWYKDGEPIDGENNSVLFIDSLVSAGAGTYLVKISNNLGSVDSSEMELTVLVPPSVIGDMISVEQLSGTSTGRVLEVSGTEPFTFVWYKDGLIIEGLSESNIQLDNISTANTGTYSVGITNAAGSVTVDALELSVLDPISITSALMQDTSSQLGSDLILSVDVAGSGPVSYEWSFNEQIISLSDSLIAQEDGSLLMLDINDGNAGLYEVKVSNKLSSASSSTTLKVTEGPRIQYNACLLYTSDAADE